MKSNYMCPKCGGCLNVGDNIIFSVKTKKRKVGLILLKHKLGDYTVSKNQLFEFEKGEHVNFYCPICHTKLGGFGRNKNLARILMTDEENNVYEILFSEIYGEKCTYKMKDHKIETFGEHASHYMKNALIK